MQKLRTLRRGIFKGIRTTKVVVVVFLSLFVSFEIFAQNEQVDSLKLAMNKAQEDSNKVLLINALINELNYSGNFQEKLDYSNMSLQLAKKIGFKKGEAQAYRLKGIALMNFGDHAGAIENQLMALKTSESINDQNGIASANNNIGLLYKNELKYAKAIPYHFKAVELFKSVGNQDYLAKTLTNLGDCYSNLASYDTAMFYYDSSLAIETRLGNERGIALAHEVIGNSFSQQRKYEEAVHHYEIADAYKRKYNDSFDIAGLQYLMATCYIPLNQLKNGRAYLERALDFATRHKYIQGLQSCYKTFALLDSIEGNYKSAYSHYKQYVFYTDSLTNEEKNVKIAQQVMQYEFEKKSLSEKLKAENNQQRLQFQQYLLIVSIIGVVLIALLFLYFNKQKHKARIALELEQTRNRISRDLHDELGSNLSSISMQASVAKRKLLRHEDASELVDHISTSSQEMVSKMSDIVWSLLSENENALQLIERITNYCAITLPDHEISFEVKNNLSHVDMNIQTETLKELYLIIKEAINNSLKHAQCKEIKVDFTQDHQALSVRISDDGSGFEIGKPKRTTGGNGLKNMRQRAEKIGGRLNIFSEQGKGTNILLEINLSDLSNRSI